MNSIVYTKYMETLTPSNQKLSECAIHGFDKHESIRCCV